MKVYVLEMDNGMEYEDNQTWVTGVFASFRSASQYLLDIAFVPYVEQDIHTKQYYLCFEKEDEDERTDVPKQAWITDFKVVE